MQDMRHEKGSTGKNKQTYGKTEIGHRAVRLLREAPSQRRSP